MQRENQIGSNLLCVSVQTQFAQRFNLWLLELCIGKYLKHTYTPVCDADNMHHSFCWVYMFVIYISLANTQ